MAEIKPNAPDRYLIVIFTLWHCWYFWCSSFPNIEFQLFGACPFYSANPKVPATALTPHPPLDPPQYLSNTDNENNTTILDTLFTLWERKHNGSTSTQFNVVLDISPCLLFHSCTKIKQKFNHSVMSFYAREV